MNKEDCTRRVGAGIRRIRERKKLSQEALAAQAGLHRNYIGNVERGERNPSLVILVRICSALKVPLSKLILEAEASTDK